jgi:hypothetical protein
LRQVDERLGLTRSLAGCIKDGREQSKVRQSIEDMLVQRVLAIAEGYEDCNDHDRLRSDPILKVAAGRQPISGEDLASQPTLTRLENSVSGRELLRMEEVLLERFIVGHWKDAPGRIVIDADATDDPTHGQQ